MYRKPSDYTCYIVFKLLLNKTGTKEKQKEITWNANDQVRNSSYAEYSCRECRLPYKLWNVCTNKTPDMLTTYFRNKNIPLIFFILATKPRLRFISLALVKSNESQNLFKV